MKRIFTIICILSFYSGLAQTAQEHSYASFQAIKDQGRMLNAMDLNSAIDLPVGLNQNGTDDNNIVSIDSLVLSPEGSYVSASISVEIPVSETRVGFGGNRIPINAGGMKGTSSGFSRLFLDSDIPLRLSNKLKLTVKGSERKTYVDISCKGLEGCGLQGEFEFCRDFLIPEMPDGKEAPEPARVKASFETSMNSWGNIMAKVSVTPFQIPALKGYGFYVNDAWVDQSDSRNPSGMIFPSGYKSPDILPGSEELWRGFFLRQVSVKLPSQFSDGKTNERKAINASNLMIDDMGVSGWFSATGVIPIETGTIGGWGFSVDEIGIGVTCNKLTGGAFKGKLDLPITKEGLHLTYGAIISEGDNYKFTVSSQEKLEVPLWGATMNLYPTSALEINYNSGKFLPRAILNGSLSLTPDLGNGGDKGEFTGIGFENLIIASQSPYITPGLFSIQSKKNKTAGFTFTLNQIGMVRRDNLTGLHFDMDIHLMDDDNGGFSGAAGITVFGKFQEQSGKQKWKYDHIELNRIKVEAHEEAYDIVGELVIYKKDPVFGSGFKGMVSAKFKPGVEVSATAQFGSVNDMRYFYVDAFLMLKSGIMVYPGFAFYGFGGGLYHHMKRVDPKINLAKAPASTPSELPVSNEAVSITPPPSGISYLPDAGTFLGIKATVVIGTYPTSDAFNADATFEISFNEKAGVKYAGIYGSGYLMTSIENRSANPPIKADFSLSMDFDNQVLHSTFDVYVNIAGQLRGIHGNNLAGGAVMHFEKNDWYITAGTPDQRIGLNIANICESTSYFMVGTTIPGMPPPPKVVSDIIGSGTNLDFMRDLNALNKGSGFCFGASLDFNTGRKQFLAFYGQFQAGVGFDIMLKNYGKDVTCAGRSKNLGVNGWYASGQAYSYLQGDLGISVDLVFVKGEYKIFEVGAAVVLQAKLPNPAWMQGNLAGYYSILNGKVKGNFKYQLTVGEECKIVGGSVVSSIKVISEMSPKAAENNVNVFNNPQVAFNLPIDKSFSMEDLDGIVKTFRAKIEYVKVMNGSSEISGNLVWNDAMDVVAFNPSDILPGKSSIKMKVRAYFEEMQNGTWVPVSFKGKPAEELTEVDFNTGEAPTVIPLSNVKYSYPEIGQYNYLKGEYGSGYIQLIKGQDELFKPDNAWNRIVRISREDGSKELQSDLSYNESDNTVTFSMPSGLENAFAYSFELVNIPNTATAKVDANVKSVAKNLTDDGTVTMETKSIEGNLDNLEEKVFYQSNFRTSIYNRFEEKMKALSISDPWSFPILNYIGLTELGINISGEETFDKFDIKGTEHTSRLIVCEASADNKWYSGKVYPLVYKNYPLNGNITVSNRDINILGLPPLKAVEIRQTPDDNVLSEGESSGKISDNSQLIFNLPFYMYMDYKELQQKCAALLTKSGNVSQAVWDMVFTPFPVISEGKYQVEMRYCLPGINKVTSKYNLTFRNY